MPHYVITYNITDADERAAFIAEFELKLTRLGLEKQDTNQSTYFGPNPNFPQAFITDLFNAVNGPEWQLDDMITVYYPKGGAQTPDIGMHFLKPKGIDFLHHVIYNLDGY